MLLGKQSFPQSMDAGKQHFVCVKQFMRERESFIPCLRFSDQVLRRTNTWNASMLCPVGLTGSVTSLEGVPHPEKEEEYGERHSKI